MSQGRVTSFLGRGHFPDPFLLNSIMRQGRRLFAKAVYRVSRGCQSAEVLLAAIWSSVQAKQGLQVGIYAARAQSCCEARSKETAPSNCAMGPAPEDPGEGQVYTDPECKAQELE